MLGRVPALLVALWVVTTQLCENCAPTTPTSNGSDSAETRAELERAKLLFENGRIDHALPILRRSLQLSPHNAEAHFLLGAAAQARSNISAALDWYAKALALNPTLYGAHYNTGLIYRHAKRPKLARASFNAALALRPTCALSQNNIGLMHYFEANHTAAVRWFRRALATAANSHVGEPKRGNATVAEVHFNLGVCLARLGQVLNAADAYAAAMKAAELAHGEDDIWVSAAMNLATLCTFVVDCQ